MGNGAAANSGTVSVVIDLLGLPSGSCTLEKLFASSNSSSHLPPITVEDERNSQPVVTAIVVVIISPRFRRIPPGHSGPRQPAIRNGAARKLRLLEARRTQFRTAAAYVGASVTARI